MSRNWGGGGKGGGGLGSRDNFVSGGGVQCLFSVILLSCKFNYLKYKFSGGEGGLTPMHLLTRIYVYWYMSTIKRTVYGAVENQFACKFISYH